MNISQRLNDWCFEDNAKPEEIEVLEKIKLMEPEKGGAVATFNRQSMDSNDVIAAKEEGKMVSEIALAYKSSFSFNFCDDGTIKSMKYTDLIKEQNGSIPKDAIVEKQDCDLVLNNKTLAQFLTFLDDQFAA